MNYEEWKKEFVQDLTNEERKIAFQNNESVMKGLYMQSDLTVREALNYFRYAIFGI